VLITNGQNEIMLTTANGMTIRFSEDSVRPMGLLAAGVNGIKLKGDDQVVGAVVVNKKYDVFLLNNIGVAKRVKMNQFPVQGRYGQGVIAWKLGKDEKLVGMAHNKPNFEVSVHLAKLAAKRVRLDDAKVRTRPSNGNSVIDNLKEGVVDLTIPWEVPDELLGEDAPKRKKAEPVEEEKAPEQIAMDLGDEVEEKPASKPKTTKRRKSATRKSSTRKTSTRKTSTRKTTTRRSSKRKKR